MLDTKHLRLLISSNKLVEVIHILLEDLPKSKKYKSYYNHVLQYSARHLRIDSELKRGVIEHKDYQLEINRIGIGIIEILDDIDSGVKNYVLTDHTLKINKIKDNHRFTEAIKLAELGIWEWTTVKEYHSPIWKIMLGYDQEDYSNHSSEVWQNLLHPDDKSRAIQEFNSFIKGNIEKYDTLFRLLCKNGQYKWILSKAKVVKKSATTGEARQIIGIHQDASSMVSEGIRYNNLLKRNVELQKKIKNLTEEQNKISQTEREKINSELNELIPRQQERLNELINQIETTESILGDIFPIILDTTTDMENILSLINQSILFENRIQSQYEKDFDLFSTIDYVTNRLNKIFKPKDRFLATPQYVNINNKVLKGYIEQTRSILYWLIKFIYRNTSSKDLKIVVEELKNTKTLESSIDEIFYKISIHSNLSRDLSHEKLLDIYKYINFQHERTEFIQNELNNGFRQVCNIVKLIGGLIEVDPNYKDNSNGISFVLKFSISSGSEVANFSR